MTDTKKSVKTALALLAAAQRQNAEALEALAAVLPDDGETDDPLLGTKQIFAETGLGHDGVKAAAERGELAVSRGPRGKLLVARSELRRYLQSKPVQPRKVEPAAQSLDDWEAQAQGALRSIAGGRK